MITGSFSIQIPPLLLLVLRAPSNKNASAIPYISRMTRWSEPPQPWGATPKADWSPPFPPPAERLMPDHKHCNLVHYSAIFKTMPTHRPNGFRNGQVYHENQPPFCLDVPGIFTLSWRVFLAFERRWTRLCHQNISLASPSALVRVVVV